MSDQALPNDGTTGVDFVDKTIQREWDRFAMRDHSIEPELSTTTLALTARSSTRAIIAIRESNAPSKYVAPASSRDASIRNGLSDFVDEVNAVGPVVEKFQ